MNKRQELNLFIKDCITKALLQMMKKQPLDAITITALVKTAGVSRVSFYRNYTDKQDIIKQHLRKLMNEWGDDFEKNNNGDMNYFSESLLHHYYKNKDFYLLLYQHELSNLIYENLRTACKLEEARNPIERYLKAMIAGTIFGWVDEWLRLGMKESPAELITLTAMLQKQQQNI